MATHKNTANPDHLRAMAKKLAPKFQKQIDTYVRKYKEIGSLVPDKMTATKAEVESAPVGFGLGFKRTDSGDIELVARYYVWEKYAARSISKKALLPRSIGGLKTDVVELGRVAPIVGIVPLDGEIRRGIRSGRRVRRTIPSSAVEDFALQGGMSTAEIKDLAARRSPAAVVAGGYSTSPLRGEDFRWAGTLACMVKAKGENKYFLSNNHVFAGWANTKKTVPSGTAIVQPGFIDDDVRNPIGKLTTAIPIELEGPANRADVALAEVTAAKTETPIRGIGQVAPQVVAPEDRYPFQTVMKAGRTTGVTLGLIYDLDANFWLSWEDDKFAWFEHQLGIMGTAAQPDFSGPGDSGSLVVDYLTNRPVGLLFAGAEAGLTFVNPIEYVLSAFEGDTKIGKLTIL